MIRVIKRQVIVKNAVNCHESPKKERKIVKAGSNMQPSTTKVAKARR
ncbi:MAG: hypothetical protein QFX36_01205 [Archaeoglobales archaeon]|nr:hypothetical protein [Archaeoglobales archaeon]MDI9643110.1 hypothetical protein [Archaeoglobales archaeon]